MFLLRLLSLFAMTSIAFAHDPALHAKEAEKAYKPIDCQKVLSSTQSNDPVSQAIAKKCSEEASNKANSTQMENHPMQNHNDHEQHKQHTQH